MLRSLIALMLLLSLLAGCSKPAPEPAKPPADSGGSTPPISQPAQCDTNNTALLPTGQTPTPGPAGTSAQPGITVAELNYLQTAEWGGQHLGTGYMVRSGTATVGTDEFILAFHMRPSPSQAWVDQHVHIDASGVTPELVEGIIQIRVPRGTAGESIALTIQNATLPDGSKGALAVRFCREEEPKATLSYQSEDGWLPVTPDGWLPPHDNLKLKLEFTRPMNRATVEETLTGPGMEGKVPAIRWESDQSLILHYANPFPVLRVPVWGMRDQAGLFVAGGLPVAHAGEQAHVAAVDPATGKEQRLLPVPPELQSGAISPDGSKALLVAMNLFSGEPWTRQSFSILDFQTGQQTALKVDSRMGIPHWLTTGDLVVVRPESWHWFNPRGQLVGTGALPGHFQADVSPDGSRFALLIPTDKPEAGYPPNHLYTYDLQILDTKGAARTLPKVVQIYRPPTEWMPAMLPTWSPDGKQIAMLSDRKEGAAALIIVDADTGEARTVIEEVQGMRNGTLHTLAWSPDGKRLAAGNLILDAASGKLERIVTDNPAAGRWSPDGQWILFQRTAWEEVYAHSLKDGRTVPLGKGLILGWSPEGKALIARWKDAEHRWLPEF